MRKKYSSPSVEVIQIKTQQMLAASQVDMYNADATGPGMAPEFEWDDEY